MQAFLNDAQRKSAWLERLAHADAGRHLVPKTLAWDGQKGSVVGYLTAGDSLDQWEAESGLPGWLGLTLDTVAASVAMDGDGRPAPAEPQTLAGTMLASIPVGADLQAAGARFLHGLFGDDEACAVARPASTELMDALAQVGEMHRQAAAGSSPAPAVWRATRKASTSLVDRLSGVDARLGAALEAACWDPLQSTTVVSDALRHWLYAVDAQAQQRFGWTQASDDQVRSRLDALYEAASKTKAPENINVFELYEAEFPEESAHTKAFFATLKRARTQALTVSLALFQRAVAP